MERVTATALPKVIDIEICNVCNYNCTVCTTGNGRINRKKTIMNAVQFERLLDILENDEIRGVPRINCIGEPFMNPDLYKIIEILNKRGHINEERPVVINTNASLIDVDRLKKLGKMVHLQVSLDSIRHEVYAIYRNNHEKFFLRAIKSIRELSRTSVRMDLFTLVTRHNENHLGEIKLFADRLGVPIHFLAFHCSPFGVTADMLPDSVRMEDNWITRTYVTSVDFEAFSPQKPESQQFVQYQKDEDLGLYRRKGDSSKPCQYTSIVWIGPDGEVLPCCLEAYYNTISFGNVFNVGSLKKIWRSRRYEEFRRNLLNRSQASHGPCRICFK